MGDSHSRHGIDAIAGGLALCTSRSDTYQQNTAAEAEEKDSARFESELNQRGEEASLDIDEPLPEVDDEDDESAGNETDEDYEVYDAAGYDIPFVLDEIDQRFWSQPPLQYEDLGPYNSDEEEFHILGAAQRRWKARTTSTVLSEADTIERQIEDESEIISDEGRE